MSKFSYTDFGQAVCEFWDDQNKDAKSDSLTNPGKGERKAPSKLTVVRQAKLEKSNQFLELYKKGLSYQAIR